MTTGARGGMTEGRERHDGGERAGMMAGEDVGMTVIVVFRHACGSLAGISDGRGKRSV
jgi:hypothetical protein